MLNSACVLNYSCVVQGKGITYLLFYFTSYFYKWPSLSYNSLILWFYLLCFTDSITAVSLLWLVFGVRYVLTL